MNCLTRSRQTCRRPCCSETWAKSERLPISVLYPRTILSTSWSWQWLSKTQWTDQQSTKSRRNGCPSSFWMKRWAPSQKTRAYGPVKIPDDRKNKRFRQNHPLSPLLKLPLKPGSYLPCNSKIKLIKSRLPIILILILLFRLWLWLWCVIVFRLHLVISNNQFVHKLDKNTNLNILIIMLIIVLPLIELKIYIYITIYLKNEKS